MLSILPVEKYRTTARAQFLASQFMPRPKEQAMSPLREILEQRRLSALFQPIIDLKSGEFLGFEGLIRGPADSPLHSPINLFGAAEQQGLQLELEMLSRQVVLETFAKLSLPGNLFLNVSPETLTNPSFKDGQTLAFLKQLGLDPARVIIEITENQPTFDFEGMRDALLHYRGMGFKIAIDDLGEGFSSLRLWSELRPEFIKIDMHFVQGVDHDPIKLQFLKSIQHIAESCGTHVIAEGVETEAELRVVKDIGIALGQGYFIARPSPTPPLLASTETSRIINSSNIALFPKADFYQRSQTTAHKLLTYVEPVHPDTLIDHIFERFNVNPALRIIPVVKNSVPLGLINRYHFIDRFSKPFQRELHSKKPCSDLIQGDPLLVEKGMPIEELSHFMAEADSRHFADGFIITENGRYIGVSSGQDLLRELTQMQLEAARYANPLTLLPGNVPINEHIERLLLANTPFVACYCDLDHFKPFNDTYSYRKGDEMIQLTGRILSWACDPKLDFIGHIGGDDFILLLQSRDWKARCEQALRSFEQAAELLFREEHLAAGGYNSEGRDGNVKFHPLTSLSIGAIQVAPRQFLSHHEVSAAMTDAKKMAKKTNGNSLFIEVRNTVARQ
ncbi:GGDEF domain-containing protein [Sideroxydans sp. CL21]|uniref:GGDEF domain-containing protein n=1 Tax=Sideroxydans sp. CL21 TaxID=2600596 RepID=UPI0012A904B5|nr:GGDEF domain-containing protein [Sideroxydans sp. CL21]VVC82628.1 diguanylate cyclase/phosphodiesterase (GGDEF & EAL domains) with PAS/PAC sensor(s) [Sideroxydans sp. CL21]